ncbi:hypothetical protein PHMEG_0003625 [Phytophthora megakarya]|uniref:Uncharacterized protein n=1 Tax=Phytophthora megakarya TaxID=4795 RepID=A0A225WXL5_9STRA|nr:hypothetical protein PHMEG_0003625 [Phytophthora megakarya]
MTTDTDHVTIDTDNGTNDTDHVATDTAELYYRIYSKYYDDDFAAEMDFVDRGIAYGEAKVDTFWRKDDFGKPCIGSDMSGLCIFNAIMRVTELAGRLDISVTQQAIDSFVSDEIKFCGRDLSTGTSWNFVLRFLRRLRDDDLDLIYKGNSQGKISRFAVKHVVKCGVLDEGVVTKETNNDACDVDGEDQGMLNNLFGTSSKSEDYFSKIHSDISVASGVESGEEHDKEPPVDATSRARRLQSLKEDSDESDGVAYDEDQEDPDRADDTVDEDVISDNDAAEMDKAFINTLQLGADTTDRRTIRRREDALRGLQWSNVSSEYESNVESFPRLVTVVKINHETNLYGM